MHIVLVYDFGTVNGGAAQVVISEALALAARGHVVSYLCAVGPVDERLLAACLQVVCLGQQDILNDPNKAGAALRGIWNQAAATALRALLSRYGTEDVIVHVHGWTKGLSSSVLSVLRKTGTPYVVTAHDYFTVCPNGGFFNYQSRAICDLKPMGFSCVTTNCDPRSLGHKVFRIARQVVAAGVSDLQGRLPHVIYISEFSRAVLSPHFHPGTDWHFVPNPIDSEYRPPVNAEEQRHFLYVGRVAAEKGVGLMCQAAALAGLPIRVVGGGPMAAELRASASGVEFAGWTDRAGVRTHMARARALVFPSEWYETFGLVVAEAMAQGLPVIVAKGTAAAEMVRDGVDGVLFDRGSLESLASAMRFVAETGVAARLSAAAHIAYWRTPRNIDTHCDELERVYAAVVASKISTPR